MQIKANEVFLMSGHQFSDVDGVRKLSPISTNHVVLARNRMDAYNFLAESVPNFQPSGSATLAEYDTAARNLRAAISGEETNWPVIVHPMMSDA